ncbi:23337_t:CDS:2, partial [Gigaspora rosea]
KGSTLKIIEISVYTHILNWLKKTHGKSKKISRKKKLLEEEQLVIRYDSPGHFLLLFEYPNLHDHIRSCIEFGEADAQRRCEIIKVRTINHPRSSLEEKYNEYLSRTTTRNYILPRNNRILPAKAHHHPALVGIAGKQTRTNLAIVEDFSTLSGITDYESIAIAIAISYVSD